MYSKIRKEGRVKEHPDLGHQLKSSTVRRIHNMLHHAMKTAVQARLIAKNPTEGTTVPKNDYPPKTVLNNEQLDRFMEEIRKEPIWFDFFYTEITTGMRRGEICALQWKDFDPERGTLKVRRWLFQVGSRSGMSIIASLNYGSQLKKIMKISSSSISFRLSEMFP